MKMPQLPFALRSTVEERRIALERCVENVVEAAARYDAARAAIGLPPAAKTFFFGAEVEQIVSHCLAEHAAKERAKLSPYQRDKFAREQERAKLGMDLPNAFYANLVEAVAWSFANEARAAAAERDAVLQSAIDEGGTVVPFEKSPRPNETEPRSL
jgi:hypothetical protein